MVEYTKAFLRFLLRGEGFGSLLAVALSGWAFGFFIANRGSLPVYDPSNDWILVLYRDVSHTIFWTVFLFVASWLAISRYVSRGENLEMVLFRDALLTTPLLLLIPIAWITEPLKWSDSSKIFIAQILLGWTVVLRMAQAKPRPNGVDPNPQLKLILLSAAVVVFAILTARLGIYRHAQFSTYAFDMGMVSNVVWNSSRGHLFATSLFPWSILGEHFAPVYLLYAPFYWILDDPRMLIVVQAILIGLSAIPLYILAVRLLGRSWLAFLIALTYLLAPGLRGVALTEVHEVAFFPLFLMTACCFLFDKNKTRSFWVFLLLALSCREDIGLVVAGLGIFLFFRENRKGLGAAVFGTGVTWFLLAVLVIIPYFRGQSYSYTVRYLEMGGSFVGIISTSLFNPLYTLKVVFSEAHRAFLWQVIGPFLALLFLSPWTLVLVAVPLASSLLASEPQQYALASQYPAVWLPCLTLAVLLAIRHLCIVDRDSLQGVRPPRFGLRFLSALPVAFLVIAILLPANGSVPPWSTVANSGRWAFVCPKLGFFEDAHALLERFDDPGASVSAQTIFVPHVANRSRVYQFPDGSDSDYLLLDIGQESNKYPLRTEDIRAHILNILKNGTHTVADQQGTVCLLKKGNVKTKLDMALIEQLERL